MIHSEKMEFACTTQKKVRKALEILYKENNLNDKILSKMLEVTEVQLASWKDRNNLKKQVDFIFLIKILKLTKLDFNDVVDIDNYFKFINKLDIKVPSNLKDLINE